MKHESFYGAARGGMDEGTSKTSIHELCHRFINAVEPGTEVPIHRHPTKDETY